MPACSVPAALFPAAAIVELLPHWKAPYSRLRRGDTTVEEEGEKKN